MDKINPKWFLLLGVFTTFLAHMTFSIDVFGWIYAAPFLIYLYRTEGLKSRLLFLVTLILAWSLCMVKIVTPPIALPFVFLFSIPICLIQLPAYLLWDRFKKHQWAILLFPAALSVMEWIQYTFTSFASWGVAAYTQSHSLTLMQSVSLFGMSGLSFLVYWLNISFADIAVKRKTTLLNFRLPVIALIILILFGGIRYELSKSRGVETIKVAAIGTDSEVSGLPMPSEESSAQINAGLFHRTRLAAKSDAKIVVWNEASTFVMPDGEESLKDSIKALSDELNILLVSSFIMPVQFEPLKYENKYVITDSSGTILFTYLKHEPVPGEPAIKGTEELKVIVYGDSKMGAVICYDYDFPYLAKGFGDLKADLVAVPSSDWRGIDPLHSRMAAFRAIEQGHSILRSTRLGLSAAITPYGEMASQMSSFDKGDRVMISQLPVKGVTTLYSIIGDLFIYLCIGFILYFPAANLFSKN